MDVYLDFISHTAMSLVLDTAKITFATETQDHVRRVPLRKQERCAMNVSSHTYRHMHAYIHSLVTFEHALFFSVFWLKCAFITSYVQNEKEISIESIVSYVLAG